MASKGLGSDANTDRLSTIAVNTWKLPDISSLHNVIRTGINFDRSDANLFSPKTRNRSASHQHQNLGGAERDRTADPLLAKQVLSQLSYSPIRFRYPNGKLRRARPVLPAVIEDHEEEQTSGDCWAHHEP